MQDLYIENYTIGADDIEVRVDVRGLGVVFCFQYSPETFKAPVLLEQHFNSLRALDTNDGSEVATQLTKAFKSLMASLAAKIENDGAASNVDYLLSDYLYPRCFVLEARASAEDTNSTLVFKESYTAQPRGDNIRIPPLVDLTLEEWVTNTYSSGQISLAPSTHGPNKVFANKKPFFFKATSPGGGIHRGLHTYKGIKEAIALGTIEPKLRIGHLHGVVIDEDQEASGTSLERRLVGVLLNFIETNAPSRMGTFYQKVRSGKCTTETLSR